MAVSYPFLILAALAWQFATPTIARAEPPAAELYPNAKAACTLILVDDRAGGVAWWIDDKGTAITAAHIVGGPGRRIELLSGVLGRISAKVVAVDRGNDAALLVCEPRDAAYPHLTLGEKTPPPATDVYLFGAPLFRENVLLRGMIARDDIYYEFYGGEKWYVGVTHVAAGVLPVTSGGVWMNARGEAIGLQSGALQFNGVPSAVAHMIPGEELKKLAASRQHARTPTLGIGLEEVWQQPPAFLKPLPPRARGLVVKLMHDISPVKAAGIKEGAILIAIDDQSLNRVSEYVSYTRSKNYEDTVTLTFLNLEGGDDQKIEVKLGVLEADWIKASQ
jgi:S1-C subfamily serine protease